MALRWDKREPSARVSRLSAREAPTSPTPPASGSAGNNTNRSAAVNNNHRRRQQRAPQTGTTCPMTQQAADGLGKRVPGELIERRSALLLSARRRRRCGELGARFSASPGGAGPRRASQIWPPRCLCLWHICASDSPCSWRPPVSPRPVFGPRAGSGSRPSADELRRRPRAGPRFELARPQPRCGR